MSSDNLLEKVKQLREITRVGFKDCKEAIDETKGDIEKSVELLRKKGIAKASKRMSRVAAEGLVCIYEQNNKFSMIEINSETDFVAKTDEFKQLGNNIAMHIAATNPISVKIEDIPESVGNIRITQEYFDMALEKIFPSVDEKVIEFYEDMKTRLGKRLDVVSEEDNELSMAFQ